MRGRRDARQKVEVGKEEAGVSQLGQLAEALDPEGGSPVATVAPHVAREAAHRLDIKRAVRINGGLQLGAQSHVDAPASARLICGPIGDAHALKPRRCRVYLLVQASADLGASRARCQPLFAFLDHALFRQMAPEADRPVCSILHPKCMCVCVCVCVCVFECN